MREYRLTRRMQSYETDSAGSVHFRAPRPRITCSNGEVRAASDVRPTSGDLPHPVVALGQRASTASRGDGAPLVIPETRVASTGAQSRRTSETGP